MFGWKFNPAHPRLCIWCSRMADLPIDDVATTERRLRAVGHAIDALRRGVPVLLGTPATAVLSAETADAAALAEFERMASERPVLVLTPVRAAAILGEMRSADPVGLRLADRPFDLPTLQALADPTLTQPTERLAPALAPADAEAALILAKLAKLLPAVLVAPAPGAIGLAVEDVFDHEMLSTRALARVSEARVPTEDMEDCRVIAFRAPGSGVEHLAIVCGQPEDRPAPLVRVHSECFTGDLLGSLRCDCGPQLRGAMRRIAAEGAGVVLYLAQEGRGIGLPNKLRAYTLQDRGLDTLDANRALGYEADERHFQIAAAMLLQLGLPRIRLLTNNLDKLASLARHGIEIAGRESLLFAANGVNDQYLATKARRFGHLLG
jgi:GTP cyclohydrolase II